MDEAHNHEKKKDGNGHVGHVVEFLYSESRDRSGHSDFPTAFG